jgi:uncharacterized ParB-like nuclease family protein
MIVCGAVSLLPLNESEGANSPFGERGTFSSDKVGSVNMLRIQKFAIEKIYVPVKRRKTLNSKIVREIAESMLEVGQQTPILVREDGDRFVLVEGLHRLQACKELGEATIVGYLVRARPY